MYDRNMLLWELIECIGRCRLGPGLWRKRGTKIRKGLDPECQKIGEFNDYLMVDYSVYYLCVELFILVYQLNICLAIMHKLQLHSIPFGPLQLKYNKAITSPYTTDIIPGVYEGGFKIWQCTLDLLKYLSENISIISGKTIMDIGCGHGLLGIAAMKVGALGCYFQDFNKDVLENITKCNILINDVLEEKCRFASGDWDQLEGMVGNEQFDIILGSEIIYKEENYGKIIRLCKKYMKPTGTAIFANKCYYFGVGGNMDDFKDAAEKNGLVCTQLQKIVPPKGGNKKEIVSIRIAQQSSVMQQ